MSKKSEYKKAWRKKNPKKYKLYTLNWNRSKGYKKSLSKFKKSHPGYQSAYSHQWRREHTEYRNEGRNRYYRKHRYNPDLRRRWAGFEEKLLFNFQGTDVELAKKILRSVAAIQVHRRLLLKEK